MANEHPLGTVTIAELPELDEDEELVLDDNLTLIDGLPTLDDETLAPWLEVDRSMTREALAMTRES